LQVFMPNGQQIRMEDLEMPQQDVL